MTITEQRKPYEFLVRWDELTGVLKGAHIQYFDALLRDGVRIGGQPSKAYGVGEGMAFPLTDILNQVQIDALAELEVRAATITTLTSERDEALKRVADLEKQLAPPPVLVPTTEFVLRFDGTEFDAMKTLAEKDGAVAGFLARTRQANPINVASPTFTAAMQYLVAKGVVASDRVASLSAPAV